MIPLGGCQRGCGVVREGPDWLLVHAPVRREQPLGVCKAVVTSRPATNECAPAAWLEGLVRWGRVWRRHVYRGPFNVGPVSLLRSMHNA